MSLRAICGLLATLAIAFAAYGSLVPLDFRYVSPGEALAQIRGIEFVPWRRASRTDFVSNVLLFVPAGFFLAGAVAATSRRLCLLAIPVVTVVALVASSAIEFSQIYARRRTPSLNDVTAETLGAVVGAVAWLIAGPWVAAWGRRVLTPRTPIDGLRNALVGYVAVWLFLGVLPLDFTLRPAELMEKYRAGRVVLVPFARADGAFEVLATVGGDAIRVVPIGMLMALVVAGRTRASAFLLATAGGAAIAAALEAAQLLVWSRYADVSDVISGTIGVAAGVAIGQRIAVREPVKAGTTPAIWPWLALAGWSVVLAVRHWTPFDFALDPAMVKQRLPDLLQVPFRNYYAATPLDAGYEAMTKILLSVPVGGLACLGLPWVRHRGATRWSLLVAAGVAAATLPVFLILEVGQMLLPTRYPDLTDVWLGGLGAAVGAFLVSRIWGGRPTAGGAATGR